MRAKAEEQLSVFLANKTGVVADLCAALTERKVNIWAMTVLDTVDIGTMRMVVDDPEAAKEAFKEAGAAFVVVPVVSLPIPNTPGTFARIARTMAAANVNIEYVYATAATSNEASVAIFRVSDQKEALELEFDL